MYHVTYQLRLDSGHSTILLRSERPSGKCASIALWQQATIEITRHDHSIIACSRHMYMVLFFAHIPFVVNRAFSATPAERLQQCKAPGKMIPRCSKRNW